MTTSASDRTFSLSEETVFAEEEVVDLFQQFFSAYLKGAADIGETIDIYLSAAGQKVCLKFAGNHLARLFTRALLHLQIDKVQTPDFTICVWDAASTTQGLPTFLDKFSQLVNADPNTGLRAIRGNVPLLTNRRIRTALMGAKSLTMADLDERLCVHWISDAADVPYYEVGAPLRVPFNFMFSTSSRQLLHGGAVGSVDGGVFLGGVGGSGKSTTALNCLSSSLSYASDDYVLVDLEHGPKAFSLYNTAKLKSLIDLERFQDLRSWIANEDGVKINDEKPMLFLNEFLPQKLIREIPLKAIVFPRFGGDETTRYRPMSQKQAFREIVTSTVRQTPGDDEAAIAMVGRLVRELPCYELIFGQDQKNVPDHISRIISENS